MFKLIVLGFAILGTNGQPVILNEPDFSQSQRYIKHQSCEEAGQAYIDAFAGSDIRVTFSCVKVK